MNSRPSVSKNLITLVKFAGQAGVQPNGYNNWRNFAQSCGPKGLREEQV